jgi:hypothetical protein
MPAFVTPAFASGSLRHRAFGREEPYLRRFFPTKVALVGAVRFQCVGTWLDGLP